MVLRTAVKTAFFTQNAQMVLESATRTKLQEEGFFEVEDLADISKATFAQVAAKLRNSGEQVANLDANAPAGSTIPRAPYETQRGEPVEVFVKQFKLCFYLSPLYTQYICRHIL